MIKGNAVLLRNFFVFLLVCSLGSVGRTQNFDTSEQNFVPLPTRFRIQDRSPDLVIFDDLLRDRTPFHNIVVGDFNGDRITDLLVINSVGDGSLSGTGRASLILGKTSLGATADINLGTDQADLTIFGPKQFSQLGYAAAAGDLNGDDIDDIILTATGTKAIYVIFGSQVFPNKIIDLSRVQADVVVLAKSSEGFTSGLAIGDINGDGFNDLIFGRQAAGPTSTSILLGPFFSGTTFNLALTEADIVLRGKANLDGFGFSIAVGDMNADGISDLVIGSPFVSREQGLDAGAVYVLEGSAEFGRGLSLSISDTQPLLTILGAFGGADFGFGDGLGSVLAIADVNADGIDDIILGVPNSTRLGSGPGPTSAGEAYIVFGSHSLAGIVDIRHDQQDVTIQGGASRTKTNLSEYGDLLGSSITVGDINGDGVADIILGAPGAAGVKDSGEIYIVLGSSELKSGSLVRVFEEDQDLSISAQQPGGLLGSVVASGDLNYDGVSDLVLEAPNAQTTGGNPQFSGVIYIYFGGGIRPPEITIAKFKESKSLLKVFGSELTGDVRIEINGVIIDREVTVFREDGLITLRGTKQELNLISNNNQAVVVRKGTRSSSVKVKGTGN